MDNSAVIITFIKRFFYIPFFIYLILNEYSLNKTLKVKPLKFFFLYNINRYKFKDIVTIKTYVYLESIYKILIMR